MQRTFKEQEEYLLGLKQNELGDLLSRRLQPKIGNPAADSNLGEYSTGENTENVFALTYDYNYNSPYAKRLRNVVRTLAQAWANHDPQIIKRNPGPLADLVFLSSYIGVPASPAMQRIFTDPQFRNIRTSRNEKFADFEERFKKAG